MPQALDTPSSLSPAGIDEQPNYTSGATRPPVLSAPKKDMIKDIKIKALTLDPSLSRHDLDYLMHQLEGSGAYERYGKPEFPDLLAHAVKKVSGAVGRVMERARRGGQ